MTKPELKIISDFNELLLKRLDAAPVEAVTAKAEKLSQMKFANNKSAQNEIDVNGIEERAMKYVVDTALGYPSLNLRKPAPVDDAANQLAAAEVRLLTSPADEELEIALAKKISWYSQMRCQHEFKTQLSPVFSALHRLHRSFDFQGKTTAVSTPVGTQSVLNQLTG